MLYNRLERVEMFNPKRDRVTLGERRAGMIVIVVTGGLGYFMILFFHLVYFSFPTLSFSERSPLINFILFPFFLLDFTASTSTPLMRISEA